MSSRSGRIETAAPAGKNSRFYVEWNLVSQSIANNTSTISWRAGLSITRWDLWYLNAVRIDGGSIGGANIPNGTWSNIFSSTQLRSGTVTIHHGSDGRGSFSANINGWLYSYGNRSRSGSWSLPTIPCATTPSMASTITIGSNTTISLPRASSSFTHRVTYSFNGQTGVIAENAGTSVVWSIPNSLANRRPNNTSGTGTITVQTKSGGRVIGTKSRSFTANIPNTPEFMPTITNYSIEEANQDVANNFSFFIQNKSQLALSMTTQGAYGSSISFTTFLYEDWITDGQQSTATSPPLPIGGTRFVGFIIVDSRARTQNDMTYELIEVEEYVDPFVTMAYSRADSTGAWDEDGDHVIIYPGGLIAPLRDENTASFKLKYKKRSSTTWTEIPITPTGAGQFGEYELDLMDDVMLIPGIDVDSPYDFVLEATDFFSTTQYPVVVPTAFTMMDFHSSGRAVSFGRVSNNPGRFEIGPKLPFNIIAPTSTEADGGFIKLRRSDDSLAAEITTGEFGGGLNINVHNALGAKTGGIEIKNNGELYAENGQKVLTEYSQGLKLTTIIGSASSSNNEMVTINIPTGLAYIEAYLEGEGSGVGNDNTFFRIHDGSSIEYLVGRVENHVGVSGSWTSTSANKRDWRAEARRGGYSRLYADLKCLGVKGIVTITGTHNNQQTWHSESAEILNSGKLQYRFTNSSGGYCKWVVKCYQEQ